MAEELIEMGRDRNDRKRDRSRRPYLSARLGASELIEMGATRSSVENDIDLMVGLAPFLAEAFGISIDMLAEISGKDLCELSDEQTFGDLEEKMPSINRLYATILVAGAPLMRFGLTIKGLSIRSLGKIMAALGRTLSEDPDRARLVEQAKNDLVLAAPDELRGDLGRILDAAGTSGDNLTPFVDQGTGEVEAEATPSE